MKDKIVEVILRNVELYDKEIDIFDKERIAVISSQAILDLIAKELPKEREPTETDYGGYMLTGDCGYNQYRKELLKILGVE